MKKPDAPVSRRHFMALAGTTAALSLIALPGTGRAASPGGKIRIGIVGSGNVGTALGRTWAQQAGHAVMFASRSLDADKTLADRDRREMPAPARRNRRCRVRRRRAVPAVPYRALPDLGKQLAGRLKGKI